MSEPDPAKERKPAEQPEGAGQHPEPEEGDERDERDDEAGNDDLPPQETWAAARELLDHIPDAFLRGSPAFGGALVGGAQHGVSGGRVDGDVVQGTKNVIQLGVVSGQPVRAASGEVPADELARLAQVFSEGPTFGTALDQLRTTRVTLLRGGPGTGRRTAALMLLRRLGVTRLRTLDPDIGFAGLRDQLGPACGYVLCDPVASHVRVVLRHEHLTALREELRKLDSWLVITIGDTAVLRDVDPVVWVPPEPSRVLAAHLRVLLGGTEAGAEAEEQVMELLDLEPVRDFLARDHTPHETGKLAERLALYHRGETDLAELANASVAAVERQAQEWLGDSERSLYDKAFLIALAAFDHAPYTVTAEVCDELYVLLQRTQNPAETPKIPVFGTSIATRLALARARQYETSEATAWGAVAQRAVAFLNDQVAHTLLRETWSGHPSTHGALVRWLRGLVDDGRPLVRTRAVAATATLATTDLPAAMALLIEPWANAPRFQLRLSAANALALAYLAGVPAVPRILRTWCTETEGFPRRRWTAVRAYALLGDQLAEDALRDLAEVALGEPNEHEDQALVEAAELLLLSRAPVVLTTFTGWLRREPEVRALALRAFIAAAGRGSVQAGATGEVPGRPLMIDWLVPPGDDARELTLLWRAALSDRSVTTEALAAMGTWVRTADRSETAERALTALLPALVETDADVARLSHLLRSLNGAGQPSAVAGRLLTTLIQRKDRSIP